jgi:WD40-like Beta Propeller Repeat/PEGA domain
MRWIGIPCLILLTACSTTRQITITARPSDSVISVDNGIQRGMGQLTATVKFKNANDTHTATASRRGYPDKTVTLSRDGTPGLVEVDLEPYRRKVTFSIVPIPAIVMVDGSPIVTGPVSQASATETFTLDDQDNWSKYNVVATREGWEPAKMTITWTDPVADYVLQLQPKRKDVVITTTPPGASVSLDGVDIGGSPAIAKGLAFPFDNGNNQFPTRRIRVYKNGYDAIDKDISWDNGQTSYQIDLIPHQKIVRILTDPAGATATINGNPVPPGPDGVPTTQLTYAPINENGDLPVYTAVITKKTAETEWYPTTIPIPWQEGRSEYSATLREIMTRHVSLLSLDLQRDSDGAWQIVPLQTDTLGMKDISESPGRDPPSLLFQAPKGSSIGSLAVNPNGNQIAFSLISGTSKLDMRSQIMALSTTGPNNVQEITDGKSLDIMPSFTPDGTQIVFSSNRAGRRLNVWRKSLDGAVGIEQLTFGNEQDLWPMIDAAPKPRLFYEVLSDSQADPQLYMSPIDGASRTDLANIPVSQPRVSPRADAILFTSVNQRTGNREVYKVSDRGGGTICLTNDPDSDCFDPAWSRDGSTIAFACDRGYATYPVMDNGQVVNERHRNTDIWTVDMTHPEKQVQITSNGSADDCPVWDPSGDYIYFRSNRGGQWGIWKIPVK